MNEILPAQEMLFKDKSINLTAHTRKSMPGMIKKEPAIVRLHHPEIRYEVTDRCNARCLMCPREIHEHGRSHGVMNLERYKKSIDEVAKFGARHIVLDGYGEPLIDWTLEQKIAYAKSKNLHTFVISNISLLTPERSMRLIKADLDELCASFLGMNSQTYDQVTVHLDYQTCMDNLLRFLEIRQTLGSKKPLLQIRYLLLPENQEDAQTFKEFWEPRADAIEIWRPHNFGDGRNYRQRLEDVTLKRTCGRPENGPFQIQWNGEVVPCCYDYNNQIVLGNAFEQPVLEILNSTKYRLLRVAHRQKEFKLFPYCDQCDQLLPHPEALIYTNRHTLPPEEAVKLSNTNLYNLINDKPFDTNNFNRNYVNGAK